MYKIHILHTNDFTIVLVVILLVVDKSLEMDIWLECEKIRLNTI